MATALVIEDDDDIRGLLEVILEQAGYAVTATATGAAGMEARAIQEPDLLLVDAGRPDGEGYVLVRQARSRIGGRTAMHSAATQAAEAARGLARGGQQDGDKPDRA